MLISLENSSIAVKLKSYGAELASLVLKEDGTEYIWQGDAKYWSGQAPVLFPIVGKLNNDQYIAEGATYELPIHGFARRMEFTPIVAEADKAVFRLQANTETKVKYPYDFELDIAYELRGKSVLVEYLVRNMDERNMWFSIGAHPGFNCPLLPGEKFEEYMLEFEQKETTKSLVIDNKTLTGATKPFLHKERTVALSRTLFANDVIILQEIQSSKVTLKSSRTEKKVTVEFPGFPYLGIWSKETEAPFVCIEPWYGIPDYAGSVKSLADKAGIALLPVAQEFRCSYSITVE